MAPIRIHRRATERKQRDWWDKIPVLTSVISSVVVAVITAAATIMFQRSQVRAARDAAVHAKKTAAAGTRIQAGALTAQFVGSLGSKDANQRKLAVIAMRESLPSELCDDLLAVIATSDASDDVRACAIEQLGRSSSPKAAIALQRIAATANRAGQERRGAGNAVVEVGVRQTAAGTRADTSLFLLGSTNGRGVAADSDDFTNAVVRGISGAADEDHDGYVAGAELGRFVANTVRLRGARGAALTPFWTTRGPDTVYLSATPVEKLRSRYRSVHGLIVAPQSPSGFHLRSVYRDANQFASAFHAHAGMTTVTIEGRGATRTALEAAILNASRSVSPEDLFVLFYTGPADVAPDGVVHWLLGGEGQYVTPSELNELIERVPAKSKAIVINACYAGAMAEN